MSFNKDLKKFHPRKEQSDTLNFINKEYIKNPLNKFYLKKNNMLIFIIRVHEAQDQIYCNKNNK